jgi:uncharacterized protein (TIGR00369 family)
VSAPCTAAAERAVSHERRPFPRHIPFVETLGFELWAFGGGKAELRLAVPPTLTNSHGMAHGGVVMTLLDVAMAHAARSAFEGDDDPGVVTIEMKTSFMRTARGTLSARGTLLHRTLSMAFTEGGVYDEAGHLCAHATGTFKYVKPPKAKAP